MHKTEIAILNLFKKDPNKEFSTTEIVKNLEPQAYEHIYFILKDKYSSKEKIKQAKHQKAQLHRKILYHLSKLEKSKLLKINKQGNKGEKYFTLALEQGQEIVLDHLRRTTLVLSKPKTPDMPIEGYEKQNIIFKLEPSTWIERLNSILIDCTMFNDTKRLSEILNVLFSDINDVIALNDFEFLLNHNLEPFLSRLNSKCSDYGKEICCIINITNLKNEIELLKILNYCLESNLNNINFIFDLKPIEFNDYHNLFKRVINLYIKHSKDIYIKNKNLHEAPYFIGKAGVYTFNKQDWLNYKRLFQGEIYGIVCAQSTLMVDVEKFFKENPKDVEIFSSFIKKIAHSLFISNSLQRRKADELFSNLAEPLGSRIREFFVFSRNYIRFWNYGWKRKDFDQEFLTDMFKESKFDLDKFCSYVTRVYNCCGMPTIFKVAFSYANEESIKDVFTKPKYQSFYIREIKDFYKKEVKEIINKKEEIFNLFDGGDLISMYRIGNPYPEDIFREVNFLLGMFKLPFFRYNFEHIKEKDIKLKEFIK